MIKIVTIDREYGSGGPTIARKLAERLGWALWDERLSHEIARVADCDVTEIQSREEREDPLYYRLFKSFLRGSFEGNLQLPSLKLLDSDRIVAITEHVVREAATAGRCVIVGRGGQYFLSDRPDAYHVFVYAPYEEKIRRERAAGRSAADAAELVETVDLERAAFIKRYFARDWPNRPLYDLMLNSKMGDDRAVETIVGGIRVFDEASGAAQSASGRPPDHLDQYGPDQ
ncbi:MAG TPA: cytidylate kinase-like family protein [Methylomirabilota bacterium]|nr:cytidylate kinase-like family protein [Candidatus Eisenbacteria bacterium]